MTTICVQDVICPECKIPGQLKHRISNRRNCFEVDHYMTKQGKLVRRIPMHRMNKKYAYSCYLGKYVVLEGYRVIWWSNNGY